MCYLVKWCQSNGQPSFAMKCRKCYECTQEKAREWGLRNMMEQDDINIGCFITLTYSEENNPVVLLKKDLQDFKHRLRKHLKRKCGIPQIRTYDCGEYGSKNYRPHFHMLIHGFNFPDKYLNGKSDRGHNIYNCDMLEKIWGRGLVTIQDMTISAAAYCARYAAVPTKFLPEELQGHPEFNTMSKSLGMEQILKNMDTYLLTDEIFYDGKKYRIPETALNKHFADVKEMDKQRRGGLLPSTFTTPKEQQYLALKENRRTRGETAWQARSAQLNDDMVESYNQARYRKENAIKRLQKKL